MLYTNLDCKIDWILDYARHKYIDMLNDAYKTERHKRETKIAVQTICMLFTSKKQQPLFANNILLL